MTEPDRDCAVCIVKAAASTSLSLLDVAESIPSDLRSSYKLRPPHLQVLPVPVPVLGRRYLINRTHRGSLLRPVNCAPTPTFRRGAIDGSHTPSQRRHWHAWMSRLRFCDNGMLYRGTSLASVNCDAGMRHRVVFRAVGDGSLLASLKPTRIRDFPPDSSYIMRMLHHRSSRNWKLEPGIGSLKSSDLRSVERVSSSMSSSTTISRARLIIMSESLIVCFWGLVEEPSEYSEYVDEDARLFYLLYSILQGYSIPQGYDSSWFADLRAKIDHHSARLQ